LQEWSQLLGSDSLFQQGLAADSARYASLCQCGKIGCISYAT